MPHSTEPSLPDLFISYSHSDTDWLRNKLLPQIERVGLTTIIDYRDFQVGAMGLLEMERAVLESRHTLVVLSPEYLVSEWCTFEQVMAQTLDPAALRRRTLPVLRAKCEIPLRLRILQYRDLSKDTAEQWEAFARDVAGLRAIRKDEATFS
jgi:hypothetical protein